MKRYEKLFACLMIIAVCAAGMALGGCTKAREKRHKISVATGAVVNSMMMTNPMGSIFGKTPLQQNTSQVGVQAADEALGCPIIAFGLSGTLLPLHIEGTVSLHYNNDCLVNGLAISGSVDSQWSVAMTAEHGVELSSDIDFDNLTMEGLVTDGSIHQVLYAGSTGPFAEIDGSLITTHADGRTRSIVYDNLTAEIDLQSVTQIAIFFPGADVSDNNSLALVVNGSATYTDEDNTVYAMEFTQVKQPFGWIMPVSGTVHLVNDAEDFDAFIDYGNGTADTLIMLTLKGEEPKAVDVSTYVNKHQYRF
jgi:hypothetical protein